MSSAPDTGTGTGVPASGRSADWILAACTMTMVLLVLDSSIVGVMLPSIRRDLDLSAAGMAWVISAYLLALAVLLPIGGRVADAIGPVTAFVVGMLGFTLASAGIAFAPAEAWLIGWRAVAGAAAALLMPATMALILGAFDQAGRARAFAVYAGVGQAFATVGPLVGGLCAQYLSWQWGFLLNVPVGLAAVVLIGVVRPANPRTPVGRWNLLDTVMLVAGLTGIVLALIQLPTWGAGASVALFVVGAAATGWFVRRSLTRPGPLLDLRLFGGASFRGGTIVLACLGFGMTVATIYGAVTLQEVLDLSPAASGLALLPLVIPLLIATRWVARRYDAVGPRRLGIIGSAALAAGLVVIAVGAAVSEVWITCLGLVPVGVGIGLLMSPMNTASLSRVPDDRRGQASGLVSTARQFGSILGIAAFSVAQATTPAGGHEWGAVTGFAISAAVAVVALIAAMRMLPRSAG